MDRTVKSRAALEKVRLTVFFEDPFWVGIFERISDGGLSACKVVFGAEPKDYGVYDFIAKNYNQLRFSRAVEAEAEMGVRAKETLCNPKRMQRKIHQQLQHSGIGTKSQQAIKLLQEQRKTERKIISRLQKESEKERRFELKQQRRKEKHRGR